MNIRIIINSLIIIFILHIILLNINNTYTFGNKKNVENFESKNNENSMTFLMSNNNTNDDFKQKMLKYIQADYEPPKENKFEQKNLYPVEPANAYLEENNVPNFESNVANTSKFYNINYDNLNECDLKSTSIDNLKNFENLSKQSNIENMSLNVESKEINNGNPYVRESQKMPDTWTYKNELPMNGGNINGVYGFDSLESQFASFNPNKINLQSNTQEKFQNIPHDDLRKPIIYEN
jgi:hypothetical protein